MILAGARSPLRGWFLASACPVCGPQSGSSDVRHGWNKKHQNMALTPSQKKSPSTTTSTCTHADIRTQVLLTLRKPEIKHSNMAGKQWKLATTCNIPHQPKSSPKPPPPRPNPSPPPGRISVCTELLTIRLSALLPACSLAKAWVLLTAKVPLLLGRGKMSASRVESRGL